MKQDASLGRQVREWRGRRRMTQLDLAVDAGMSSRHLSFVETGRSRPSRNAILRIADALSIPLRGRNAMLLAAGYAPVFEEQSLESSPQLKSAVEQILHCHLPFPALAVDRGWNLVAANAAVGPLMAEADPRLLAAPVNVLRLSLHPDGMARRIVNLAEWKRHILHRLRQQVLASGDNALEDLVEELSRYPAPTSRTPPTASEPQIAMPLVLDMPAGRLNLISTTTVFGTAVEVTSSELTIETFFPADKETAALLRVLAGEQPSNS